MNIAVTVLQNLFSPVCLIFMFLGSLMGIIFGALPGLSGTIGVTLLLPMTFGMSPELGIALLISIWIGGVSGGFISATLLGIPGTSSCIATCFDAYPLSKKGQTTKALAVGITASFIGTFFSCIIAMFLSPVISKIAVKLGPWEYFSLCLCAIVLVVSLAKDNIWKGMAAASIGFVLQCVGAAPIDAVERFTFGDYNLYGGFDSSAVMLGAFAVFLVVSNYVNRDNDYVLEEKGCIKGFGLTLKEFKDNIVNMIRSFAIGLWIGFLPGMGAGLSNLVAYGQAKASSKHPEEFGKGTIEGVFATETSNNASVGGAMIPMASLGIPGDATTAVLLGGLTIHGLEPGPLLFQNKPVFVYVMFGAAILAAVMVLVMQLFGMRLFPKILKIPYHYLYSVVLALCFVGAFSSTNTIFNVGIMLFFGAVAFLMSIAGLPSTPFILAFILGGMIEKNLRRGFSYSTKGFITFLTRPVSLLFLIIAVLSLVIPVIKDLKKMKVQKEE
ncbi:Tat pathway signal protein [Clostridium sp. MCC353]|uniref:tripartite tricarboxylate transporter permease n=1 Tax=Clostridium sp. MCC353 TaxID=2592646 RepID=UPI001C036720|nr:tripartite tricarboxylate transporter permease [Clostridium sp. MCC353]MBT9780091.1 Tat pathway signal protein [Clostridium sp. MCC353]